MTAILELTKQKHHDRLGELDRDRQKPQAKLADKIQLLAQLREQLNRLGPVRPENKIATDQFNREIASIERDVATVQGQIDKIDGEAQMHHAQIRELERPNDFAKLRELDAESTAALNAARIILAEFFLAIAAHGAKYALEGVREAAALRDGFIERERTLLAMGWKELDAVAVPYPPINFRPLLPPATKS